MPRHKMPDIHTNVRGKELSTLFSIGILGGWYALMKMAYYMQAAREQAQISKEMREPSSANISSSTIVGTDRSEYLLAQNRKKMVDHPLVSWIVENGAVWFSSWARMTVFGSASSCRGSRVSNFLISLGGTIFTERLLLLSQWLVVRGLYDHIPSFFETNNQQNGPTASKIDLVYEWLRNSVSSQAILASMVLLVLLLLILPLLLTCSLFCVP